MTLGYFDQKKKNLTEIVRIYKKHELYVNKTNIIRVSFTKKKKKKISLYFKISHLHIICEIH